MIAFLGMYDMPHMRAANDAFWALVRDGMRAVGIDAPEALSRDLSELWSIWRSPELVLGQTCGLPFQIGLREATKFVGTPDYALPDCAPGYYFSEILVRAERVDDPVSAFHGAAFAYNDPDSNSGWSLPRRWALAQGITLRPSLQTGSHAEAARAVAEGRAELMGIDAQTRRLMQEGGTMPDGLAVVSRTESVPGLPLICAQGVDAAAVRRAVNAAIAALPAPYRATLHLRGLSDLGAADYDSVALR